MRRKSLVLIAGAVVALVGLVLLRMKLTPPEESFFRSEIWLPHQGLGEGYNLALPFEGPISGEKVSLDEARSRMPFSIPLPSYLPGSTRLMDVYASRADTATEFQYKGWPTELSKGDIFLSDFPPRDNVPDHAAVIVGASGGLKDQHSPPRKQVAWDAYAPAGTAYWSVHVTW
jgi:hypothetical protein